MTDDQRRPDRLDLAAKTEQALPDGRPATIMDPPGPSADMTVTDESDGPLLSRGNAPQPPRKSLFRR